ERWYKRATIVEWQPLPQVVQKPSDTTSVTLASAIWQYRAMRTLSPHSLALSSPQAASRFEPLPTVKPGLAFAVFDEYIVMAESATVLEAYIDTLPEEGSLMENAQFQRTMQRPQYEQSFMVGHGNLGQLLSMINTANQRLVASLPSASSPLLVPQLPPEALAQLKTTTDSIDAYLWAQRDGIQLRYLVQMDRPIAGLPAITPTNHANKLLNRLPASSYLSLNSADLKSIWRLVLATMETQPALAQSLGELRRVGLQELGLDDHDVFSWMDGEFALCLFPSRKGFLGSTIGMALVVQTSERSAAEAALRKFDAYAQSLQIYSVKPRRLQGQWATSWDAVYANESLLAHGWLDQSTLLITNGTGPMAEIMPKPAMNLASASEFQSAVAPLPKENTGYSYINVKAASNLMFNYVLPQVAPPEVLSAPEMLAMRKALAGIRSISATVSHQANRSQVDFFLALRPALPPKRQR
ncbi:MAG: DUF3352 domain-containing protein, partial [Cyanobacteria bacterium]|nr:DUF3352 domain-containing protein [Cyanobacteriota bacterium]MDW8203299.1 DUF3352 domain-containing protein [Cyanobacteriota bacterium SKYGB_h_bin112]